MNPEVSVIILAYNTEKYIAQAINSALQQTEKNIEIIIVDDGSTDNTLEVINSFFDKRIKVLVNQRNLGQNFSTNRAIKVAKGNWITRLDSDDWYAVDRLEKLLKIANSQNVDIIADDIYFIQDGKNLPWSTLLSQSKYKIKNNTEISSIDFIEKDVPGMWGLHLGLTKPLIKINFIQKHNIKNHDNILIGGDFWFYLICLAHGAKFLFVPNPYYFYRSRPGSSVAQSRIKRLEAYCEATKYYLQQDYIINNQKLLAALQKRLYLIEKTRPYFLVVDSLKQTDYLNALIKMKNNPYFFYHLSTQIPRIIRRRLSLYFNQIPISKSR
ncbi:glycosyl transferase [Rivularia sp. PCC 7116]|uniref:glycosyltransferase family 2 protein n=1 Tax=Rivularia sp. PCC 7116 TaxID=373994 RepID=UPI00029F4969|nr:glycosyltransferase family 2 protein [Rivularia sp. PCC 7116]AFY59076.1 glycosyl transferase [Rivularia sp. PCC 7116]